MRQINAAELEFALVLASVLHAASSGVLQAFARGELGESRPRTVGIRHSANASTRFAPKSRQNKVTPGANLCDAYYGWALAASGLRPAARGDVDGSCPCGVDAGRVSVLPRAGARPHHKKWSPRDVAAAIADEVGRNEQKA